MDLLERLRPDAELHPQFLKLRDDPMMAPARGALEDVAATLSDPDGNLIEQFQTHGFDARTFEIYLYALLTDEGHAIDRSHDRPDFLITKGGITAAVEAVTANVTPTGAFRPYELHDWDAPDDRKGVIRLLKHEVAIRFGSPLFSKLRKRYWDLPHVDGLPFVIAIQSFHPGSLMHSSTALSQYLFGLDHRFHFGDDGGLVVGADVVGEHVGSKTIPSNFFGQPGAENVSAVLFSNAGTIPKFGRIGQQGRHRSGAVRMIRHGTCFDHNPHATRPELFAYEVGDTRVEPEPWRDGAILIHNPRARHPLPAEWLGAAAEENLGEGGTVVLTWRDPFIVYESITMLFRGDTPDRQLWKQVDEQMRWRQLGAHLGEVWR